MQAPPLQVYRAETRPLSSAPQESAFAPVSHLPTSAFSLPNTYLPVTSAPVNAAQMGLTQPVKLPTSEASAFVSVANVDTAA
ncbi:hypothetical protein, partial [Salmonella enterica]|uniref:hypothetical protein n=1 Tax=Salmonella enterica TaxID=28901 RepID=UPI0035262215